MALRHRQAVKAAPALPEAGRVGPVDPIDLPHDDPLDEIALAATHELLPPLRAIQWLAETVRASAGRLSPDDVAKCMESILRSARYLGSLIDHFPEGTGEAALNLDRRATDVGALITQTVEDMAGLLGPRSARVSVERTIVAYIDPTRTREVLINLLANAAKFSPEGTPISIDMHGRGGHVEVNVSDHCNGIPEQVRQKLFYKHVRLGGTGEGTGLGLYFARGIARAHGGDLTVSAGRSEGCRFTLTLPSVS